MSPLHCESKRKCSPSFGRGQQMWQQICITVAAFMEENWSFFFFPILLFSPNPLGRELMISLKWDSKICAGVWLSYGGSGKFTGAFLGVGYSGSCTCMLFLGESLAAAERPEFAGSSVTKAWGYLDALGCRLWLCSDCPASSMGGGNREKMHRWGQEPCAAPHVKDLSLWDKALGVFEAVE